MALKKKIRRTQNAIINKIRGTKKTDAEREKEIKEQVAEQTRRMRDIKGILEAIDFSLSELPSEELEKKMSSGQSVPDYELVRKMAVAYLDQAKATEMDTSRIDESIRYAANAFAEGVKYGQLNKARWGMVAMMHLIQYEREDVDETDRGQFAEMAVRKERQAENYVTMLKECKKLDNREKRKAKLNSLYRKFVDEFEAKRAEFNRLRETEEGEYAMGELEDNRERYSVCLDTFYAVILDNQRLVVSPEEVREGGNRTLYIGFYLPELEMADLTNCNAGSNTQWTFQEKTA